MSPSPEPRYVANLAARTGIYIVSIRQVISGGLRHNLFATHAPDYARAGAAPLYISLQALSDGSTGNERIIAIAAGLRAIDNTGHALSEKQPPDNLVGFQQGSAQVTTLTAPAAGARYLRSVSGILQTVRGKMQTTRPFTIRNVPLPFCRHTFGLADAALLTFREEPGPRTHGQPHLYRHEAVDRLKASFPPYVKPAGSWGLPNRLILQDGVPASFDLPIGGIRRLRRTIHVDALVATGAMSDASVTYRLTGDGGSTSGRIKLWDNEPVVLASPGRIVRAAPAGSILAVRLHLFHDMPPVALTDRTPPAPFPAHAGARGASAIGRLLVAGEPVEMAKVTVLVERVQALSEPVQITTVTDDTGEWRVANMDPGRYRFTLLRVEPARITSGTAIMWDAYAAYRYGVVKGAWKPLSFEAPLGPGSFTVLPAWQCLSHRAMR